MEELKKAIEYFDNYINASVSREVEGYSALEIIINYNILRAALAKLTVEE